MSCVIIGGTGTLGRELAKQLVWADPSAKITVFSRDELKQSEMRGIFPAIRYVLGDVRDRESVRQVLRGAETVFLLAAIKHIDAADRNPLETVKTNFIGAVNVAEEAIALGVRHVVFSNTDKAVLPITTYGYSKALAQNYLLSLNGQSDTKFSVFNWGNIAASRGSVIPAFVQSLTENRAVCITDKRMSRFWLRIEDAAAFLLANYERAPGDRAMIPPVKGATVVRVAATIAAILGVKDYKTEITGLRCTEKIHEVLESTHKSCLRSDTCAQYTDQELRALLEEPVLELANESRVVRLPRRNGKALPGDLKELGA